MYAPQHTLLCATQRPRSRIRAARSRPDARRTPAAHCVPDKRSRSLLTHALPLCDAPPGAVHIRVIGTVKRMSCATFWSAPAAISQQQLQFCGQPHAVGLPAAAGLNAPQTR
eukprot:3779686-Prymnesium_polylepis.1